MTTNLATPAGIRWKIGETAVAAFESIHRLNVTIHDLAGTLGPFLLPHRFHHRSPCCLAAKAQRFEACARFDIERVRQDLARLPEGRVQVCHAGLVEWVTPVFEQGKLCWILFAGQRLPGPDLDSAERAKIVPWPRAPWGRSAALPKPVGNEEAQLILEHLRQLAARLRAWVHDLNLDERMVRTVPDGSTAGSMTAVGSMNLRRTTIQRFIEEKYNEPLTLSMLAQRLCLSPSRTGHVVRRVCQAPFRELVIQKRLRVAMDLLRHADMTVLDVAMASGFDDVAHFHRLFRRRIGLSPGRYRVSGRS